MSETLQVSIGELADRMTILATKALFLSDTGQRAAMQQQAAELAGRLTKARGDNLDVAMKVSELMSIHVQLWQLENSARAHVANLSDTIEQSDRVTLISVAVHAKSIQVLNGRRHQLKAEISSLCGDTEEPKQYWSKETDGYTTPYADRTSGDSVQEPGLGDGE